MISINLLLNFGCPPLPLPPVTVLLMHYYYRTDLGSSEGGHLFESK